MEKTRDFRARSPRGRTSRLRPIPRDRQQLAQILRAKRFGFTLCEIRQMLDASGPSAGADALSITRRQCFDQIKLLEQRKREIEAALGELRHTYSSFYARLANGSA